jgi:hypothetical protein
MEALRRRIDELIERRSLPWARTGGRIEIELSAGGRRQVVYMKQIDGFYRFWSVVAPTSFVTRNVKAWRNLAYRAWRKNDAQDVIGFSFDDQDRLIGCIDQPVETVDHAEIAFYIDLLARECDRFEYRLSGEDRF